MSAEKDKDKERPDPAPARPQGGAQPQSGGVIQEGDTPPDDKSGTIQEGGGEGKR